MSDDGARPHTGLSLREYAAVFAATAEGFPLDRVLEHYGIDARTWSRGEDAWSERLMDDDEWQARADERFLEAQAGLARRVPPLDEDLEAWLDFVRIFAAEEQQLAFLGDLGLRPTDVLRLHRLWSARLETDPALRERAVGVLRRDPARLPVPKPEEARLPPPLDEPSTEERLGVATLDDDMDDEVDLETPPPSDRPPPLVAPLPAPSNGEAPRPSAKNGGARHEAPRDAPPPDAAPQPPVFDEAALMSEISLLDYATISAELRMRPNDADAIFARFGLSDPAKRDATNRAWQAHLQRDADDNAVFLALFSRALRGKGSS